MVVINTTTTVIKMTIKTERQFKYFAKEVIPVSLKTIDGINLDDILELMYRSYEQGIVDSPEKEEA